ncbi:hypothetical protein AURANDRAFT_67318 [Aureococcus anophagefferens]|uniref:Uncharacterized protein n=1 Tax=Aureococcus anophagefferens TaxID=44056 RepID=F0YKR3_AURAN|nr:hypothetical protein AURANDRAFT_67318 [Aureococcus anophagefferens]EGB04280.1 hypothetical protein AURANDRAFT_67318 [Aureococcus anophagefferens]|eukprot:XP_009040990.1 hypothetical protein AURANDRAFT_67318 [Aureococcus anophagefferens]
MDKQLETEPKPKKKVGRPRKYHTDEEYKAARKIQNDKYTAKIKKMRELCKIFAFHDAIYIKQPNGLYYQLNAFMDDLYKLGRDQYSDVPLKMNNNYGYIGFNGLFRTGREVHDLLPYSTQSFVAPLAAIPPALASVCGDAVAHGRLEIQIANASRFAPVPKHLAAPSFEALHDEDRSD